jgi:fumarate reductase flavoprotein subunit
LKSSKNIVNAELVIVGAGGAGLPAAIAAHEAGLKNIVLVEKNKAPGGNMLFAEGTLATETTLQMRSGTDTTSDIIFKKAVNYAHWNLNPRLMRALINISGDNIKWLEKKGVVFDHLVPHFLDQSPVTFHATSTGKTGAAIVKVLLKECHDLGLKVFTGTSAKKLLTDKQGRITGIQADSKEGEIQFNAGAVILATGGFAGNTAMLKKYAPWYQDGELTLTGMKHMGDGIKMASEVGGLTDGMVTLELMGPFFAPSPLVTVLSARPINMWININGERFVDEGAPGIVEVANAIYRQPHKKMFAILDREIFEKTVTSGVSPVERMGVKQDFLEPGIAEHLKVNEKAGRIMVSKSWSTLAEFMGIPFGTLKKTVDEYNNCCERGYDEVFLKEKRYLMPLSNPPFYVIPCGTQIMLTHGGIKVNDRCEVVNVEDRAIPGLYAAGVETGGTDGDTYNMNLSGHSSSFAVGGGRIAGKEAAAYLSALKKK